VADQDSSKPAEAPEGSADSPRAQSAAGAPAPETKERELREAFEKTVQEVEKTRLELQGAEKRFDEIARAYSSLVNDQKDFRARLEREKERVLEVSRGDIALHLLELGDELDRALGAAASDEGPLVQGVRLIREGLTKRLSKMGIERLDLLDRPFDPLVAEAIDLVPVTDEARDDTVVEEVLPGYRLGERLLRPARVRVARLLRPAASSQAPEPPVSPNP